MCLNIHSNMYLYAFFMCVRRKITRKANEEPFLNVKMGRKK